MPASPDANRRVAIVGASSLRGKELKQLLEDSALPCGDLLLFDEEAVAGTLAEAGGEAMFIHGIEEDSFDRLQFAFFTSSAEFAARHWPMAYRAGATVIDLSGALAEHATAIPWIPALASVLPPPQPPAGKLFFSPSAAAVVACTIAAALVGFSLERLAIVFFQPVSESGQVGIEELESQTVNLLSFRPIAQGIFDAQVAFNLLGRYGEASEQSLGLVRAGVAREVARYVAGRVPLPAIQFVQAPVFYSYAFTVYAEFAAASPPRDAGELEDALVGAGIKLEVFGEPAPSNISVAGEGQIVLARVEPDPNVARGYWLWGAADNVRLAAANAFGIAEKLLAS